jgi:IclR family mhp operon transcriptional activator
VDFGGPFAQRASERSLQYARKSIIGMHLNRSLGRGLRILNILNSDHAHTVASTFRILRTLIAEGFVRRDADTDTFHPTAMVRGLSDGFDDTAWLVQVAKPFVAELGRRVVWPVSIATLSGTSVLVRQTTDETSPLAVVRYAPGARMPLGNSASGLVLLAFSRAHQRRMLIDLLYQPSFASEQAYPRAEFEKRIQEVANLGYAWVHRPGRVSERSSLAVPVQVSEDTLCAVVVRFARSAVRQQVAAEKFLPALRHTAHAIVEAFGSEKLPAATAKIARNSTAVPKLPARTKLRKKTA